MLFLSQTKSGLMLFFRVVRSYACNGHAECLPFFLLMLHILASLSTHSHTLHLFQLVPIVHRLQCAEISLRITVEN